MRCCRIKHGAQVSQQQRTAIFSFRFYIRACLPSCRAPVTCSGPWGGCRSHQFCAVRDEQLGAFSPGPCFGNDAKPTSRGVRLTFRPLVRWRFTAYLLWARPLKGMAVVNDTPAVPGFGPPGVHPQAFGPSWAGALRLQFWPQVSGQHKRQLCRGASWLRQQIMLPC